LVYDLKMAERQPRV